MTKAEFIKEVYLHEDFISVTFSKDENWDMMRIAHDFQQGDCFWERKMKSNEMQFGYVLENE